MKIKIWLKYLVYGLVILASMSLSSYLSYKYKTHMALTFQPNLLLLAICILINMIIGAILGFERFIKERRKDGRWKINLPKMILLGIPSFYVSIFQIAFYSGVTYIARIMYPIAFISGLTFGGFITSFQIFQILFGYCVITSLYKRREEYYC